ncbi:MAG: NHLP family bacteriocin export ABC transporter peptidase/permease/ATPase subunit [Clostridia bacterium]|nr:NHLP family bacteriocin export ABC transporter peptidase/permease/ATPase subunit [Clostridia bacterium]
MSKTKKTVPEPKKDVAKTPVVMQMEALECGAACITMIMAYYSLWIPLEQVRRDCGVSRDGSKALNMLKAARSYGMDARGYKFELEDLKEHATFPCIVHWNFNHFIVLNGFRGNKVYINDPAKGSIVIPMEDFDKGYTGICLMFKPTESFVPSGKKKSILGFVRKRMQGTLAAVVFTALTTIILSLMSLINSGFTRVFMDQVLPGGHDDWLFPVIAGMSGLAVIQIVVSWLNVVYSLRINGKLASVGETSYMWRVLHLPMEFFSQRLAGDILQRKSTNAGIASSIVNMVAPLLINTVMVIFYLVVMLRYNVMLTLVGISSMVINIALSRFISSKRINISRVMMRDQSKLTSATMSGISLIETIKASGAENGFFQKWAGYQARVNTQNIRFTRMNMAYGLLPSLVQKAADISILILGVLLVMKGQFTVGMVLVFQGFLSSFTAPAMQLIGAGQTIQEMRTQMERIEDVMEYPISETALQTSDAEEDKEYEKLSGEIELKNVTFGYAPLDAPLITDFSMKIPQGGCVAFVGTSGCGKSTLAKLISGLYSPWSGEILFDGKPINEIDRNIFTGSLAVVDQDIMLFEDTVANNISMWDKSIEDYEITLAARDAQIHDAIVKRDGGYLCRLQAGGTGFSGGEKQRLEIARVLAQDPTMIIMDEATSALDAKTEFDVVRSIKDRGVTCIVIAHRLSTIRDCDEIIVLDHGRVVERGTHEELLRLNGVYTKLVTSE